MIIIAELKAACGVLGEVWIKRRATLHTGAIVSDHLLERCEATVMHVGSRHRNITQARRGKFSTVRFVSSNSETASISIIFSDSVVMKLVITEKRAAVTVKTIRTKLTRTRLILSHKKLKPTLFHFCKFGLTPKSPIKFSIVCGQC